MSEKLENTQEQIEDAGLKQMEQFRQELINLFESHGISDYVVCVKHPARLNDPMALYNEEYKAAQLAASMHAALKQKIISKIN